MKKTILIFIVGLLIIIASFFLFNYTRANGDLGASVLWPQYGGTGTTTPPSYGQMLVGNAGGTYTLTATSSLGLTSSLTGNALTKGNFIVGSDAGLSQATSTIFLSSKGGLDLANSNITYLTINDDIESAVTAATAGDTLILAAGTYTITEDIDITKAINIVGQGVGKTTITTSSAGVGTFHITADNVRISDMSIVQTGTGTNYGVYATAAATSIFTNIRVLNVAITMTGVATINYGMYMQDAGGEVRDATMIINGSTSSYGIYMQNNSTAEATTTLNVYSVNASTTAATTARAFSSVDNSATKGSLLYLFDSNGEAQAATLADGLYVASPDAYAYIYDTSLSGSVNDVYNSSSGNIYTYGSTFVNGDVNGVIANWNNITYVPINGNIETYVTNATAGDTLILAAGTYTITDDIDITKAINIMGQGVGKTTVTCATADKFPFDIQSDNVRVSDMSITNSAATGTNNYAVRVNGSGGTIFSNVRLYNLGVNVSATGTNNYGILYWDAGGEVRDVTINLSGSTNAYGLTLQNGATAEASTTLKVYDVNSSVSSVTNAFSFYSSDSTATNDDYLYLYNCQGTATTGTASHASRTNGDDAYTYLENSILNGSVYDVVAATSGIVSSHGSQFVNNKISGTINYDNTVDYISDRTAKNNKSGAGALYFDGTTASTRIYHTLNQNIGTSDFTAWARVMVPSSNPSTVGGIFSLASSNSTAAIAASFTIYLNTDGNLYAKYRENTSADYIGVNTSSIVTKFGGQIVDIVAVRNATTPSLTIYINGNSETLTTTQGGTNPTWAYSITSTYALIGAYSSTTIYNDRIYKASLFNRALTAAEVKQLTERGIAFADEWGNLNGVTSGTLQKLKKYRITTYFGSDDFTNVGASANATSTEFTATGAGCSVLVCTPTTWTSGTVINEIGAILDSDLENANTEASTVVKDRSSNAFVGTATSAGITQVKPVPRFNIITKGATSTVTDLLVLSNQGIDATSMADTQTGLIFKNNYYSATAPLAVNTARIYGGTEGNWTSTASTQDGYFGISTSLDGTLAERLRITSAGNVGIGTTSPYSLLSITNSRTTTANTPLFTIASTTNGTATSTHLTVLANGNVGIGTASPSQSLYVNGGNIYTSGNVYAANSTNVMFNAANIQGSYSTFFNITNANASGGLIFKPGNSEAVRFTSVGLVGIGTTSPYSLLSISNSVTTAINTPLFTIASTTNGTATSTHLTVLANGNVGVGTTTPYAKLSVSGIGAFDSINANSSSATSTFTNISVAQLENSGIKNCDTVDTDANGFFKCGTDSTVGSGGTGTVGTSTSPTIGQLAYWTTKNAWPELLGSVATTTLTEDSLALSLSQPISVIGGTASTLSLATSSLFTFDGSGACGTNLVCLGGHNHDVANLTWANDWMIAYSNASGLVELPFNSSSGKFLMSNGEAALTWETAARPSTANTFTALNTFTNATTTQLTVTTGWLGTILGTVDAGGAAGFEIPNGASGFTNTTGQMFIDSTSGQLRYNGGSATSTLVGFYTMAFQYATSSWSGTTTKFMAPAMAAMTVQGAYCTTDVGSVGVSLWDGTNRANYIATASTTENYNAYGTNNAFTAGEPIQVDLGTPASSPTQIGCRFKYIYDAD